LNGTIRIKGISSKQQKYTRSNQTQSASGMNVPTLVYY